MVYLAGARKFPVNELCRYALQRCYNVLFTSLLSLENKKFEYIFTRD